MKAQAIEHAEEVRLSRIAMLQTRKTERDRLDRELSELPRLEKEQRRIVAERKRTQARKEAASEVAGSIAAVLEAQPAIHEKFLDLLPQLSELRTLIMERERQLQFAGRRCVRASQQFTHPGSGDPRRMLDVGVSVNSNAGRLWIECGGDDLDLTPFPSEIDIGSVNLDIAQSLLDLLTGGRIFYQPAQSSMWLRSLGGGVTF